VVFFGACAFAQDTAYQNYVVQIEALQRDGADIAQHLGRDALVQQYRDLINAHPGYANNIRLETQIAMLYESDFTDQGQPPDYAAADQVYQNIIANYDPEHPYMMTVRKLAADRAVELDPARARQMYESIVTDYPEQDALVVQSQYALGKLAEEQGDPATAEKYYNQVLSYAPTGAPLSQAETASIDAFQTNAAASMLTAAIEGYDTPQERLKALKKFLEKHKDLERAQADLIQRFAETIERSAGRSMEDDPDSKTTLEALLASLKKDKSAGEGASRRDRTREQRTKEAEAERTRIARAEATMDAVLTDSAALPNARVGAPASKRSVDLRETGSGRMLYILGATIAALAMAAAVVLYKRRPSS
jgi:hypothetical protein